MGPPQPNGSNGPFKPVPPPKPKNYRPPLQGGSGNGPMNSGQWENGVSLNLNNLKECIFNLIVFILGTGIAKIPQWVLLPPSAVTLPPFNGPQCAKFTKCKPHEPESYAFI